MNNPFAPILIDEDMSIDMDEPETGLLDDIPDPGASAKEGSLESTEVEDTEESNENTLSPLQTVSATLAKFASVSDVLRMFGAVAVAGGMGMFLLDGFEIVNDLQRFMTMLGFSVLLTGAGLTMSKVLQEQRGSRVFVGLALLSVPVNFVVLGALLYSVFPWDGLAGNYPGFAHWQVADTGMLLGALAAGALVVLPVIWFGLSVMARSARSWMSVGLLASCTTLLLPIRHELWVAVVAMGTLAALWWLHARYADDAVALKTSEGRFALAILFLPPVIMIFRSILLYDVSGILGLSLSVGVYVSMYRLLLSQPGKSWLGGLYTIIGALSGMMMAVTFVNFLDGVVNPVARIADWIMVIAHGIAMGSIWILHHRSGETTVSKVFSLVTVALVSSSLFFTVVFMSSPMLLVASTMLLVAMMTYAYIKRLKPELVMTTISAVLIVLFHAEDLFSALMHTGWWGIALAGMAAIVCGSLLERVGPVWKLSLRKQAVTEA